MGYNGKRKPLFYANEAFWWTKNFIINELSNCDGINSLHYGLATGIVQMECSDLLAIIEYYTPEWWLNISRQWREVWSTSHESVVLITCVLITCWTSQDTRLISCTHTCFNSRYKWPDELSEYISKASIRLIHLYIYWQVIQNVIDRSKYTNEQVLTENHSAAYDYMEASTTGDAIRMT